MVLSSKRATEYGMLLTCQGSYPQTCQYFRCRQQFVSNIRQECVNHPTISLQLRSASDASQEFQFDLKFIDLTFIGKSDHYFSVYSAKDVREILCLL